MFFSLSAVRLDVMQGLRSSSSAKYVVQRTRTKFAERALILCRRSICVEHSICRSPTGAWHCRCF